jgi:tetratricopeptide (TPR) repeat protein
MAVAWILLHLLTWPGTALAQARGAEVTEQYHAFAELQDFASLVDLWRENRDLILRTIDGDLEGSLSLRENSDEPDEEAVTALHERALFGAAAAGEATGNPIFLDYTAAFVGWDAEQQQQFRAGQAAFGRARQSNANGEYEEGMRAGTECLELAEPLGDWWGMAMGLTVRSQALMALERPEEALVSFQRARQIHHDLGLQGSEYANMLGMIDALGLLKRSERQRAVVKQALDIAHELGDADNVERLANMLTELDAN